jgi:hypothetical protein
MLAARMVLAIALAPLVLGCGDATHSPGAGPAVPPAGAQPRTANNTGGGGAAPSTQLRLSLRAPNAQSGVTLAIEGETESFSCTGPDRTRSGLRWQCKRGAIERLDLVIRHGDHEGAAARYPNGFTDNDARQFFTCAATALAGELPSSITCERGEPVNMIDNNWISPFKSEVPGLSLRNARILSKPGQTLFVRANAPLWKQHYDDIKKLGIQSVIIFKNAEMPHKRGEKKKTEIDIEKDELKLRGITNVNNGDDIQFHWFGFKNFSTPCTQTVDALKFILAELGAGHRTLLHCTVGEDRTGYLAGLYRMMTEHISMKEAFSEELCEMGYSAGNAQKPYTEVQVPIDRDLTPVFLHMAHLIESGQLTVQNLDQAKALCEKTPDDGLNPADYICPISTRYRLKGQD